MQRVHHTLRKQPFLRIVSLQSAALCCIFFIVEILSTIYHSRKEAQIKFSIGCPCGRICKTTAYESFVMVSSVQTVVNQSPEGFSSLNVKNRRESFCFKGRPFFFCSVCLRVLIASPCVKRKTLNEHRKHSTQSSKTS